MDAARDPSSKTLWPLWLAIGLPLLLIALSSTPIAPNFAFVMIGVPVLLAIWGVFGVWSLMLIVRHIRRREWSYLVSSAALPLAIFAASLWPWQFLHLCNNGGDIGYFIMKRSFYLKETAITPPKGEPRLIVFNRGGMLWASRGYVYDESDEIMRNQPLQSTSWRARADGTELTCGYHAQAFPGHFSFSQHWYLASFNC